MTKLMEAILKRENIDLPVDTLKKLSLLAITQGKSLKAYIEYLLIAKANSIDMETANPSPSGDPWFNEPENIQEVKQGIADIESGKYKEYSIEEIKNLLGA